MAFFLPEWRRPSDVAFFQTPYRRRNTPALPIHTLQSNTLRKPPKPAKYPSSEHLSLCSIVQGATTPNRDLKIDSACTRISHARLDYSAPRLQLCEFQYYQNCYRFCHSAPALRNPVVSGELGSALSTPSHFHNGNSTPLQSLDIPIHDLNWFFHKVEFLVDLDLFQREYERLIRQALLEV
ncbi:hypothetical protein LXL04_023683 [Taraxacum kok-saghyz]